MIRNVIKLTLIWALLMGLAGIEFVVSGHELGLANRPVIMAPALAMVMLVALFFMRLVHASTLAKGFAVMAMFWLIVLFGLGSMDALTRSWYPVIQYSPR